MTQDGHLLPRWSDVPIELLHAELTRRKTKGERPPCGSGNLTRSYNTSLHVAALFLILVLSTLACCFPIVVRRFPRLPVPNYALFLSRHFGTGVLIATAFVHLFPTAYTNLTDPCLPSFWNERYPPMAGFIAMVSVLLVVGIEMFFALKGAGHSHHHVDLELLRGEEEEVELHKRSVSYNSKFRHVPLGGSTSDATYEDVPADEIQQSTTAGPSASKRTGEQDPFEDENEGDSDLELDELDPVTYDGQPLNGSAQPMFRTSTESRNRRPKHSRQVSFASQQASSSHPGAISKEVSEQRAVLQCLLLEAGILFHSIFIGMALSVATGPAFGVLLLAISFHQTFEGLALGSRIAAIKSFSTASVKPWLMSVMYGITTPLGQAIGLGVHTLYDPASQFGLLTVGIVNAISSGLLLYAGLVQLLAEDFLSDQSYVELQGRRRLEASAAVVGGAMLMAAVGAFA